eukprot:TRINITY_DN10283_c0_g3_i3.p1 TRINITY_DN10283_c0_g3~~TRINITY_DN10283_c0_g3_i3.p1  ORF type:complete len:227 (+),score=-19.04 TRINITY_DN10283_c0_g3_i3:787-1467(+)
MKNYYLYQGNTSIYNKTYLDLGVNFLPIPPSNTCTRKRLYAYTNPQPIYTKMTSKTNIYLTFSHMKELGIDDLFFQYCTKGNGILQIIPQVQCSTKRMDFWSNSHTNPQVRIYKLGTRVLVNHLYSRQLGKDSLQKYNNNNKRVRRLFKFGPLRPFYSRRIPNNNNNNNRNNNHQVATQIMGISNTSYSLPLAKLKQLGIFHIVVSFKKLVLCKIYVHCTSFCSKF